MATWEGGALVTRSVGGTTFDQRRYMEGDEMVNELSFPAKGGLSMTRRLNAHHTQPTTPQRSLDRGRPLCSGRRRSRSPG